MDKNDLQRYVEQGLSLHKIAVATNKSLTTVRYWAKKHGIKSVYGKFGKKEYGATRVCPRCNKEVNTSNFYQKRGKPNSSSYCKSCTNLQTMERQREFKKKCVEYKGGKCQNPNCPAPVRDIKSYDFHHLNPDEKDFEISRVRSLRFDERVTSELDKCLLLCACCHREV